MARTIKEIYNESVRERNKRLELSEFSNDSKLSVMNGLTWAFAAVIYSFEVLLDVFAIDISNAINSRINGTPDYYANALLQYQKGDIVKVREDGLAFGYEVIDGTKRIITQVSYSESTNNANLDNKLILKVATGEKGKLSAISPEDLLMVNAYISRIKFAGTRVEVTSLKGDVLIPRVTVYYDGAVLESEIYDSIDKALNEYIMDIEFNAGIYVSKALETIRKVAHVTDVHIDGKAVPEQGIFVACYDTDGHIGQSEKIGRVIYTSSGYIKESTCKEEEANLPNFRQSIKLVIDRG
ncbi:hypothetical protein [Dysgonomonas termitidis]|uniref:Uncharacterized protein n=1 Tax=Dysgonomonas termitidis TaxID=1516126 RepID=A0ABV9KQW5_9BACT